MLGKKIAAESRWAHATIGDERPTPREHLAFCAGWDAREEEEKHNGWVNRETGACHLTSEELYDIARSVASPDDLHCMVEDLWADIISAVEIANGEYLRVHKDGLTMLRDIGSLGRVNWQDIYDALHDGEEGE